MYTYIYIHIYTYIYIYMYIYIKCIDPALKKFTNLVKKSYVIVIKGVKSVFYFI